MSQYIQLVSNTTASTPVDIWTPATNNVRPLIADQVAAGYFKNFSDNTYEFSSELYYKWVKNTIDYIEGPDLLLNPVIEGDLLEGKNRAYGLELMLNKTKGRFTGWLSYTLAKTENLVEGINRNDWYPTRFDQTHNLSISTSYELNDKWSLSANFAYITGTPTTFPSSRYEQQGYTGAHNDYETRNNVRIPAYHRLDIGATRISKPKMNGKWQGEWVFSIYNAYNRRNAFSIFLRPEQGRLSPNEPVKTEAIRLSVIGNFIPSVSYNFNFN